MTDLNREAWLTSLAAELMPLIHERTGKNVSASKYRLSCGFPSSRARATRNATIGKCWHMPGRETREIFIHPKLGDGLAVAETALHELLHAVLPPGTGHRKPFSQAAKKVGLEGKPTATFAGDELREALKKVVAKLGPYPHEALDVSGMPKQATRLLKGMCPVCGYTIRVTAKWIDEAGYPLCPQCDTQMEDSAPGEEAHSPLVSVHQSVEYKVKAVKKNLKDKTIFDPRWSLRMNRNGRDMTWFVIDYGTHLLGTELPRLTPAESREDALALLEALRDGMMTYKDIETDDDIDVDFEGDPDPQDDQEDLHYLADDEDEDPDYAEDQPEDDEGYAAEQAKREAWVGVDGCGSDSTIREEREIGSWQSRWTF